MADTKSSMQKHTEYADSRVDEQAITDKFNAATAAQFNVQREQNRQAENQFYNQMYNTQQTAMDTIRKSNAAAVSTGASRGVQAANELSAILGLEQESVAGATELAQANRQTAQEETAAVLENILKAYQQAAQERQNAVQQSIESASVDVQQDANEVQREANEIQKQQTQNQAQQTQADIASALVSAAQNGTSDYLTALGQAGKDYATVATTEGLTSLGAALDGIVIDINGESGKMFAKGDWAGHHINGESKADDIENKVKQICAAYNIPYEGNISDKVETLKDTASENASWLTWAKGTKDRRAEMSNEAYTAVLREIQNAYSNRLLKNK